MWLQTLLCAAGGVCAPMSPMAAPPTCTSQMTMTGDQSEKRVIKALMSRSASRIFGPVLYHPTIFSRAAQGGDGGARVS